MLIKVAAAAFVMASCAQAPPPQARSHADAGVAVPQPRDDEAWQFRQAYASAYLAEVLRSDVTTAADTYRELLSKENVPHEVAAQSALRLAELQARAGRRLQAGELLVRARSLGRDHVGLVERADRIQTRLASVKSHTSEVRGPPASSVPAGLDRAQARDFAKAETSLEAYYRKRLRSGLEVMRGTVKRKERALETAVRQYRAVGNRAPARAGAAAEFRVGSLHHDLAIELFVLSLDATREIGSARLARQLRGQLTTKATLHLKKARQAYQASLEFAGMYPAVSPAANRWRLAARRGLKAVADLLSSRR